MVEPYGEVPDNKLLRENIRSGGAKKVATLMMMVELGINVTMNISNNNNKASAIDGGAINIYKEVTKLMITNCSLKQKYCWLAKVVLYMDVIL